MIRLRFLFVVVLATLASIANAGETLVTFAGGRAEVVIPDNFTVVSSDTSGLVATFGPKGDHKLELSLNDIESSSAPADLGEQFVRAQAEKKGRKLTQGAGRVVFMDPAGDSKQGEVTMRVVHWQVGFGRSVVVMTLTAPVEQPMSSALQEFLGRPLNVLVTSLRRLRPTWRSTPFASLSRRCAIKPRSVDDLHVGHHMQRSDNFVELAFRYPFGYA